MEARLVQIGDTVTHKGVTGVLLERTGVFETNGVRCVVLIVKVEGNTHVHTWKMKANREVAVSR